jgi:hypothetical protein
MGILDRPAEADGWVPNDKDPPDSYSKRFDDADGEPRFQLRIDYEPGSTDVLWELYDDEVSEMHPLQTGTAVTLEGAKVASVRALEAYWQRVRQ